MPVQRSMILAISSSVTPRRFMYGRCVRNVSSIVFAISPLKKRICSKSSAFWMIAAKIFT